MSNRAAQRTIKTFLKSRRQLIVELMRLSRAIEGHLRERGGRYYLERFCQDMVDYLSIGYFRVFCGLVSPQTWTTAREYAIFDATTSTAMTFNDHHAGGDHIDVDSHQTRIRGVALALETRFELEDEVLNRSQDDARDRRSDGSAGATSGGFLKQHASPLCASEKVLERTPGAGYIVRPPITHNDKHGTMAEPNALRILVVNGKGRLRKDDDRDQSGRGVCASWILRRSHRSRLSGIEHTVARTTRGTIARAFI